MTSANLDASACAASAQRESSSACMRSRYDTCAPERQLAKKARMSERA
jgi:hypothetical protein